LGPTVATAGVVLLLVATLRRRPAAFRGDRRRNVMADRNEQEVR